MLNKILVATDGSASANSSLKKAGELAKMTQAQIYVLTVVPEVSYFEQYPTDFPYGSDLAEANESRAKLILDDAKKRLDYDGPVETFYVTGSSAKEIINFAEDKDVDLIVLGNRGLGAFSRTLLGSVSTKVINHTDRSVIVVKEDHEEE